MSGPWRSQQGGGGQRRGLYVKGDVEEGVVGSGGVAARAAHHVRLQQAPKDTLQGALPLLRACAMHIGMSGILLLSVFGKAGLMTSAGGPLNS